MEVESDGTGPTPTPIYRIWRNRRCLVATRRESRLPRFAPAAAAAAERGWPVVTRISGGTMVPHLPESLHLSLLLPRLPAPEPDTEQVYRFLAEPVRETLLRLGVTSRYGTIPRSFCDGRFNLVAGKRKLAGTSQRWTGGLPGHPVRPGFVLAHLTLFVEGDMAEATRAVNRFLAEAEHLRVAGSGAVARSGIMANPQESRPSEANTAVPIFDPDAAVTVAELAGEAGEPPASTSAALGSDDGSGAAPKEAARTANAKHASLVTQVANTLEEVLECGKIR